MSTTRLTSRVASGSLWSFGGQSITLLASLISTPFVIRLLGPESYGVLALVNVTLVYLAFADLGMGAASTRFASSRRESAAEEEVGIVWTSLIIAAVPSLFAAAMLFAFAPVLAADWLRLPSYLQADGALAFRLAAAAFVARTFAGVLNTPLLARLRIRTFTLINNGTNVLQVLAVLFVLLMGGGLVSALVVIVAASVVSLVLNTIVAIRLLPALTRPRVEWSLVRPLLEFGGSMIFISFAGAVLFHIEKPLLTRLISIEAFAFYAVAFLIARTPATVPGAVHQSLLPALSRLQAGPDHAALQGLYERAIRGLFLWSLPLVGCVWVFAEPLLHLVAGAGASAYAAWPLRLLLLGTLVDSVSFPSRCLLEARGKPHRVALWQLALILPYAVGAFLAISSFGALGAAAAWALRATVETAGVFWEAHRDCRLDVWTASCRTGLVAALALFATVLIVTALFDPSLLASVALVGVAGSLYVVIVWKKLLVDDERRWLSRWGATRLEQLRSRNLVVNG